MKALKALSQSRKFWTAVFTILAISGASFAVSKGWVAKDQAPTLIMAITTLGGLVIAGTAYEDGKQKEGQPPPPPLPAGENGTGENGTDKDRTGGG